MKHILFIVTNVNTTGSKNVKTGYEFSEIADPYIEFIKHGFTIDFASIKGGKPPEDGYIETHTNSKLFRNSAGFKRLNFSHKLSNVDTSAYDALFFPGGLGPMIDMYTNSELKHVIQDFYENEKVIGAVCHGPVALLNVKLSNETHLLSGKNVTSFTIEEEKAKEHTLGDVIPFMLEDELKNEGVHFHPKPTFEGNVVVDGTLITGQNPASATGVALEMIKQLT